MSVNELSPLKYVSVRVSNDDMKEYKDLFAYVIREQKYAVWMLILRKT